MEPTWCRSRKFPPWSLKGLWRLSRAQLERKPHLPNEKGKAVFCFICLVGERGHMKWKIGYCMLKSWLNILKNHYVLLGPCTADNWALLWCAEPFWESRHLGALCPQALLWIAWSLSVIIPPSSDKDLLFRFLGGYSPLKSTSAPPWWTPSSSKTYHSWGDLKSFRNMIFVPHE